MPYGADSRLDASQAINCLATIVVSLRDNHANHLRQSAVGLFCFAFRFHPPHLYNSHKSLANFGCKRLSL